MKTQFLENRERRKIYLHLNCCTSRNCSLYTMYTTNEVLINKISKNYQLKIYHQGMSRWLPGWNKRVGLRLLPARQQPTVGVQLRRLLEKKHFAKYRITQKGGTSENSLRFSQNSQNYKLQSSISRNGAR